MADATKPPPTLADLRREIDRIDEAMHRLLMERGDIIDRLIATKKTAESGSAFRPAREADMMRRLVERHRGILPLDTAESIWRVIIATFTYVQAPYSVHADLSAGEAAMRDTARFHFGFTVPFVAASRRGRRGGRGRGLARRYRPRAGAARGRRMVDRARRRRRAEDHRAAAVRRARRPSGRRCRCSRIARPNPDAMVTDVEIWSVRVAGWGAGGRARARTVGGSDRRAGPRLRRRGAAGLGAAGRASTTSPRRSLTPAPRCAPRPSSAATRPVIPSPPKARSPAGR